MIRLFAAVEIPKDVAHDLERRQQGIPGARWRPLEALHVTLAFYGEVEEAVAAELDAGLAALCSAPFEIVLDGVGLFGDGEHIHAVWAGVQESPALIELARRCRETGRRAGVKMERRLYRPHVTLAYLKRTDPARAAAWVQAHNLLKSPPIRVSWFGLWSSWLSPDGSRYDLEREYALFS